MARICAVLLSFVLVACTPPSSPTTLEAIQGVLDLSQWNFDRQPIVPLKGEWAFVWNQLLGPSDPMNGETRPVPGLWSETRGGSSAYPVNGQATYRLTILLPPGEDHSFLLKIRQVDRAYRVFVGDLNVVSEGRLGPVNEGMTGVTRYFPLVAKEALTLTIPITSHWDSWGGGFTFVPELGLSGAMVSETQTAAALEGFFVGLLLIMALYHLILSTFQVRNRALWAFAFICLFAGLRQMVVGDCVLVGLWSWPDELIRRLSWATSYALLAAVSWFFFEWRLSYARSKIMLVLGAWGCLGFLGCLILPQSVYGIGVLLHGPILILGITVLVVLYLDIRKGRPDSLVLFAGFSILLLAAGIDIVTVYLNFTAFLFSLAVLPFLLLLAWILARRFAEGIREAEALRQQNGRYRELDQAKSHFFANVSHELRTPLSLLVGPLEAVAAGDYGSKISVDHPVFRTLRSQTARMLQLVENLLTLTRLDQEIPSRPLAVAVRPALEVYLEPFQPLAASKNISLSLVPGESPVLWLDPRDLETVLFNLLSNAVKFTPPDGSITLSVQLNEGRIWVIEVADTGIGIDADQQGHLFQRFRQVYDRERGNYQGSGLGLSIAHESASRLGGQLTVESTLGVGSRFRLLLPLESLPEQPSMVPQSVMRPPLTGTIEHLNRSPKDNSGRVLLVEDHDELRAFLATALATEFEVAAVGDGEAALQLLKTDYHFDLVVSDLMMPRLGGVGLFEAIQGDESLRGLPFVILTARASEEEKLDRLNAGVLDYLEKPFSPLVLRAKIRSLIGHQRSQTDHLRKRILSALEEPAPRLPSSTHPPGAETLSVREREILERILEGKSDKGIASELGISIRTVSNHVGGILKKLGCRSRGEVQALWR